MCLSVLVLALLCFRYIGGIIGVNVKDSSHFDSSLCEGPWQCLEKAWKNIKITLLALPQYSSPLGTSNVGRYHLSAFNMSGEIFCCLFYNFLICTTVFWQGVPQHNYLTREEAQLSVCFELFTSLAHKAS